MLINLPHLQLRLSHADPHALAELAPYHYLPHPPATLARVIAAHDDHRRTVVAVLTVSFPVLNAPWRQRAWPALFAGVDNPTAAARANALLRTISRVIVHPAYRGGGVATALLRAYLRQPLTELTEAVAAMGSLSPLFLAAGFARIPTPLPLHDQALRAALAEHDIPLHLLACPALLAPRVLPTLESALRTWAAASSATRPYARAPLFTLLHALAHRPPIHRPVFVAPKPSLPPLPPASPLPPATTA